MNKHLVLIPTAVALSLSIAMTGCTKKSETAIPAGSASSPNAQFNGPVAKVNGKEIPGALAELIVKNQLPPGTPITADLRQRIKDSLVQREILLQAAKAAGYDKRDDVKALQAFMADTELANFYIKDWIAQHQPNDADLKAFYDEQVNKIGKTDYKARHILVKTEDEAKAIIAKLDKGAKFDDLAKADSKDPGSAKNGGELGWSKPSDYAPEFGAALKTLEKGKYTKTPVKTQFGYHVILLEDSRPATNIPKFESVKAQLSQQLAQENLKKYVDGLKDKAKVE